MKTKLFLLPLFLCSTLSAFAQTPSEALLEKADNSTRLVNTLITGVEECFNPRYGDAKKGAIQELRKLGMLFATTKQQVVVNDIRGIEASIGGFRSTFDSFNRRAPFPASLSCATNRACLELGFEGNARYERCQPVNGDIHANSQFLSLIELLDREMPAMLSLLEQMAKP